MWLLTNITSGNVLIVIKEKSKYTVGRVGADLVISDDSSISRTHAFLHIAANQVNDTESSVANKVNEILEIEDAGSKYGTFHNDGITQGGAAIPKQKKIILSEGDRIRFGVLKSVWKVSNITPIVAISVLPTEHAQLLKQYMDILGGCVLNGWNEKYTHLTLAEINMTSKLLHALLDQKPIVTCDYWCNVVQAARRGRRSMPQITSFMPPNPNNIDVAYRTERHQLFKNLTFVFLHAHHFKTYASIVEKAGGKSKHLNVGIQKSFLVRKDVVVVQYIPSTESQSSQTINTIEDCLKLHSRRTVPEFEIGLAIIQCSTEKYCNPSYKTDDSLEHVLKLSKNNASESCKQASSKPLTDDETEVFIPETDRKSTASTHLTDKSLSNQTTGSIESRVEQTDTVTVESQAFEPEKDSVDVTMSSLQVTGSPQEANKRKRGRKNETSKTIDSHMDSDDDELFNFTAKKAHLDDKSESPVESKTRHRRKSTQSNIDEIPTTSAAAAATARQTPKSSDKQLPIEINKRTSKRNVINMAGFLEKSHVPIVSRDAIDKNKAIDNDSGNQTTKRARIAVIDNSDDDDLFCFSGKDDASHIAKRACSRNDGNDSDEDLFNFGGAVAEENNYSKDVVDAEEALNESTTAKNNHNHIVMPKPKQLPAKICITAWLDCSLSALNIKAEEVKKEVEDLEKKENNDSGVEGDSKDNIEDIKGGCVVTKLNTKSLLLDREQTTSKSSMIGIEQANGNLNGCIKNFKKFARKFQPQNRRVIRTVSSTVCGSLI